MNLRKLKNFIILQIILFVKGCLCENTAGSFNDKVHSFKLPLKRTTRLTSTYQLKALRLKAKQNFQMMKRSKLKTNIKNYFLKQYNDQKD